MANQNIKLRKQNFTVKNGYFYTFDEDQDALLQKTDDGNTAFSYPLDTILSNQILDLEYDGVNFWTLENDTDIRTIKRWRLDNYICKLQQTLTISFGHTIDTNCFAVEHYHTNMTTTVSGGDTVIYINEYSNNPNIIDDVSLHLGPNQNGEEEEVDVIGTVFGGVTLASPAQYEYAAGKEVNFHRRLWFFNDYNGTDDSTGALYKLSSSTGGYMSKYEGGAYKDVNACTFYKIESFTELGPKDMLMYNKGTNTLFVNIEEEPKTLADANTVNDSFTGDDDDPPNTGRWLTENGSPTIQSNKLHLALGGSGSEGIRSKYYLDGDFEVYVKGDLETYNDAYVGSNYYQQSLVLLFPNESDRFCKVSRGYSTEFGGNLYQNFSSIARVAVDTVISGVSAMHGIDEIDDYALKIKRVGASVHFDYRTVISGVTSDWYSLGNTDMFDSDAQLLLMEYSSEGSIFNTNFDDLTYLSGQIAYMSTAIELPYYGSMVMDNIGDDEYTIIPLYDMSIDANNMYRLQLDSSVYNYYLSPLEPFVTSISLSASPAIIAANGASTTDISAWVKDQFLQPIANRTVNFSENGDGSLIGGSSKQTDADGFASTVYQAGTSALDVILTATVTQTN